MDIKITFAQEIVERFHSKPDADYALEDFQDRHSHGGIPDQMPEVTLAAGTEPVLLTQILKQAGLTSGTSEAMRMIEQGGVKLNGEKISDKALKLGAGPPFVAQVGKRKFARITIR
jgi:tyrosyl-tRNA synthetase